MRLGRLATIAVMLLLLFATGATTGENIEAFDAEMTVPETWGIVSPESDVEATVVSVSMTKILFENGDFVECTPDGGTLYPVTWDSTNVSTRPFDCSSEVTLNLRETVEGGYEISYRNVWWVVVDGQLMTCEGDTVNPLNPANCTPDMEVGSRTYVLWTGNGAICNVGGQVVVDWQSGEWTRHYGGLTLMFDDITPYIDTVCNNPPAFLPDGYRLDQMRLLLVAGRETVCDETVVPSDPEITHCRPGQFVISDALYR